MNRGEKSSNLRKKSGHNGTLTWGATRPDAHRRWETAEQIMWATTRTPLKQLTHVTKKKKHMAAVIEKLMYSFLQRHKCTWAFSDCGETFPVERERMWLPPRKGSGTPEGTQCRTWCFSKSRDSYRLSFVCITSALIIVWHSLFATFCLCRRGRASGC